MENEQIITERFNESIKEVVEPYKSRHLENKTKIIALACLVYRKGAKTLPANFLFSIISDILDKTDGA